MAPGRLSPGALEQGPLNRILEARSLGRPPSLVLDVPPHADATGLAMGGVELHPQVVLRDSGRPAEIVRLPGVVLLGRVEQPGGTARSRASSVGSEEREIVHGVFSMVYRITSLAY